MEQPQYNLFVREKVEHDYLPLYDLMGLGTTIWSPLASGALTGKYNDGIPADSRMNLPGYEWLKKEWTSEEGKAKLETIKQLATLAKEIGLPMHHLALLWCLQEPARLDGDPGRLQDSPARGQPGLAQVQGQADPRRDREDRSHHGQQAQGVRAVLGQSSRARQPSASSLPSP